MTEVTGTARVKRGMAEMLKGGCLLYTSDAADEMD
jgi:pyridoxal biosynthesis lyase PdxS